MIILIPPSEGKEKIKSNNILFGDTDFKFKKEVKQIIRLLEPYFEGFFISGIGMFFGVCCVILPVFKKSFVNLSSQN